MLTSTPIQVIDTPPLLHGRLVGFLERAAKPDANLSAPASLALGVEVILICTTLYISFVIICTKYARLRQNGFNVYA
jgi:hypothetical protein